MKKNITVTWANEKGGVGKTTLCTLFANYLSEKKMSDVCVLDCDRQHSIVDKRKFDSQSLQTDKVPYEVKQIEIDRLQQSAQLLKSVKTANGIYLFDSPGNIYLEGMVPLLGFSDVIVCPYQYEFNCLSATQKFLNLVKVPQSGGKDLDNLPQRTAEAETDIRTEPRYPYPRHCSGASNMEKDGRGTGTGRWHCNTDGCGQGRHCPLQHLRKHQDSG